MEKDIFQDIPDTDLPLLKKLYKDYEAEEPYVVTLLYTCIQWKKKNPRCNHFTIMGMDNDWLKTGTFVVVIHFSVKHIFFHTLLKNYENFYKAFMQTKRIDWDAKMLFFSIIKRNAPILNDIIDGHDLPRHEYDDGLWTLSKEKALEFEIEYPNNVYIKKLDKSHVALVNDLWPFKHEGSDKYMETLIEYNSSYGIFLNSNDELVSWVLRNNFGQLASLTTVPEYVGNGYALTLTKLMSKEIAEEGYTPSVCIVEGNVSSENLFTKLGYKCIDRCMFNFSIK